MFGERRVDCLLALLVGECREGPQRIEFCHARADLAGLHAEARSLSRAASALASGVSTLHFGSE